MEAGQSKSKTECDYFFFDIYTESSTKTIDLMFYLIGSIVCSGNKSPRMLQKHQFSTGSLVTGDSVMVVYERQVRMEQGSICRETRDCIKDITIWAPVKHCCCKRCLCLQTDCILVFLSTFYTAQIPIAIIQNRKRKSSLKKALLRLKMTGILNNCL